MFGVILRAVMRALQDDRVTSLLLRIIERAIGRANEDQLARIRADLQAMESRVRGEISALGDRVELLERRVEEIESVIERRRPPAPPPPLPEPE